MILEWGRNFPIATAIWLIEIYTQQKVKEIVFEGL